MKQLQKVKMLLGSTLMAAITVAAIPAAAFAAPAGPQVPPRTSNVSGTDAKPAVAPGSKDAKASESLGKTNLLNVNKDGAPLNSSQFSTLAGSVSTVDFTTSYNYCYKGLTYPTIKNNTSSTQYVHLYFYNQSVTRDAYYTVPANGYVYPPMYGVEGNWSASLYTWNGSAYQYDEYKSGNNTCKVDVTRVYNAGGWVQLKIQNTGTAYATQVSSELAPYPGAGTYTGTHYDAPAAGGAAIYRWFSVGTSPYAISSYTSGSFNNPVYFTGDL